MMDLPKFNFGPVHSTFQKGKDELNSWRLYNTVYPVTSCWHSGESVCLVELFPITTLTSTAHHPSNRPVPPGVRTHQRPTTVTLLIGKEIIEETMKIKILISMRQFDNMTRLSLVWLLFVCYSYSNQQLSKSSETGNWFFCSQEYCIMPVTSHNHQFTLVCQLNLRTNNFSVC